MSSGFDLTSWLSATTGAGGSPAPAPAPTASASSNAPPAGAPVAKGADALLQAVIHGDSTPHKPEPQGVVLSPGSDSFDIDAKDKVVPQQLQVAPITVVKTEYREQVLHQIASNSTYICYGLKAGQIRVLNKETTNRTLLKGHTCMVVDMKFFGSGSNVLASCDQSGEVFVRRIFEDNPNESIQEDVLVRHKFSVGTKATKRLAWHPQLENLLAMALDDRIVFINVPPTSGVAASAPEFAEPIVPSGRMVEGTITCVSFSARGDLLAASDDVGRVYVWALPADLDRAQTFEPLPTTPHLVFDAFPGDAAGCMEFLPSCTPHGVLVVGDATARRLSLWVVNGTTTPDEPSALQPPLSASRTYELALTSSRDGPSAFFNHLLVQPNFSVVVLANTKKQQVYVLHAHQEPGTGAASFDYASLFEVKMPILSMTTLTEDAAGADVFKLYCVQTEAIQEYMLYPASCFPSVDLEEEVARQVQLQAEAARPVEDITPVLPPTVHTPTSSPDLPLPPSRAAVAAAAAEAAAAQEEEEAEANRQGPVVLEAAPVVSSRAAPVTQVTAAPAPHALPTPFKLHSEPAALLPQSTGSLLDDVVALAASMSRSQQPSVEAVPEASTVTHAGGLAHRVSVGSDGASSIASDAASPGPGGRTVSDLAAESSGDSSAVPAPAATSHAQYTQHTESATSQHTQHADAARAALKQAPKHVSPSPGPGPSPPPQPSLLLRKMGSASASSSPPAPAAAVVTATAAVASLAPTSTPAASEAGVGAERTALSAGGAASGDVLAAVSAQVSAGNRELLRVLKAEIKAEAKAQAKASEAALSKAVETLRAELKAQEKRDREELSRVVGAAVSTLTKELGTKLSEGLKAIPAQVAAATKAAVAEALPAATATAVDKAVAAQVRIALPAAVSSAFASAVLPAFERATATMFGQIQDTFTSGLATHLATASGANQAVATSLQESVKQMGTLVGSLHTEVAGLRAAAAAGAVDGARAAKPAAEVASRAAAPRDPKTVASGHLRTKKYDEAFEEVLSANNQDTLLWLLKQLQPNALLGQSPCPLSQGVMLSLLSHLAHALGSDTELRLQWIQEVASCVDPHDAHTSPYLRSVLEPIKELLTALAQSGTPAVQRVARMTVHVVNSLLHQ